MFSWLFKRDHYPQFKGLAQQFLKEEFERLPESLIRGVYELVRADWADYEKYVPRSKRRESARQARLMGIDDPFMVNLKHAGGLLALCVLGKTRFAERHGQGAARHYESGIVPESDKAIVALIRQMGCASDDLAGL